MSIQQSAQVFLNVQGDGTSTVFVFGFTQLFDLTLAGGDTPLNAKTVPNAVAVLGQSSNLDNSVAVVDGFGNLTLTFNTPPPAGQIGQVQLNLLFNSGVLSGTTAAWTNATAVNSTWTLPLNGAVSIAVGFVVSGSITGGTILFEVSQDGAAWFPVQGALSNLYTAVTGWQTGIGSLPVNFDVAGFAYFRLRLNPVLTGTGSVTFILQATNQPSEPTPTVGQSNGSNLHMTLDDAAGGNPANTVAKGTQAARALGVQDLKDSGRTYITLYVDRIAGVTTEALITMSINKAGTVTTGTSYTVTAGKTFRIMSFQAEILDTTTTANRVLARVRAVASGSVLATSPILAMALAASPAALAATGNTDAHEWSDGIELPGGSVIGISQLASITTAGIVSLCLVGYEY